MQSARMFGNYVSFLAEKNRLSNSDLGRVLDCSDFQVESLLKVGHTHLLGKCQDWQSYSILQLKSCWREIPNITTQLLFTV